MNGRKVNKKPTIKEITNSVLFIKDELDMCKRVIQDLEKAFSLYVEMKDDNAKFSAYIDVKIKEWKKANDAKENGKADKPNLQGDTDGESSRPKRVRKKSK